MVRLRCFKKKNTGSPAKGIFLFSKEKDKQNKQVHKILAFPICSPIHLNSTNVSMRSPNSSKDKLPKIYSRNLKFWYFWYFSPIYYYPISDSDHSMKVIPLA